MSPPESTMPPVPSAVQVPLSSSLDARGLACPLPLLKAKQGLSKIASGEYLRVLATDQGSVRDFHSYCRLSGHEMHYFETHSDGTYDYVIQKTG